MLEIKQLTDVGLVRKQNEDSIRVEENFLGHYILILADGMGGHNAGDVASQLACQIIGDEFVANKEKINYKDFLQNAILKANKEIYKKSIMNPDYSKMGTTASVLIYDNDRVYTGHIGDSRIYFLNEQKIEQISKDHTLVRAMVESGSIVKGEEKYSKYKNVLLQALGTSKKITVEIKEIKVPSNFTFLLCSDGLTGEVSDDRIHELMLKPLSLDDKLTNLINCAKDLDGSDNISVIVIENRSII